MNPDETVALARYVRALCPQQKFDEYTPDAWHDVLRGFTLPEARAAAITVASRQAFVAPGEIVTEARRARAARIAPDAETEAPPVDPDQAITYAARLQARRLEVATGRTAPLQALPGPTRDDVKAMRQQDDLKAYMRQAIRDAADANTRRKALVRRYPDLWEQVHELHGHKQWSGSVGSNPHTAAIVAEAEARNSARGHSDAA
ncbi:hypothetical protein [Streptomyces sp. NBC_01565]|uniref:hypothetical protein n=1 Tax=Streptomyces sp. NBC_01565 TaxID=2975881 RepID=UPI00225BEA90|nr:hypothetical protein [Streptomyces sp. NBC_01565]MCX4540470.1 hypothetical protein [Streptomyces sp. NBC_01565]